MPKHFSMKQIKAELEKKATLDEKQKYLEEVLKKIKGTKLREKVEALLKEAMEHIGHEEKFVKDKLEQKISAAPAETEAEPRKSFGEIKYVPRGRGAETAESGLEREVKSAPAETSVGWGPPKYVTLVGGVYANAHEAVERARILLESQGLMKRMSADEFYNLDPARKQQLFQTVSSAFGKPLEDYETFQKFVKYVAVKTDKEEPKYIGKKW